MQSIIRYFAAQVAKNPCRVNCTLWGIILVLSLIVTLSGWLALDETVDNEWSIVSDATTMQSDAYADATSKNDLYFDTGAIPSTRTTFHGADSLNILYAVEDGTNVFTPRHLRHICELEQSAIMDDETYADFCRLDPDTAYCMPQSLSVSSFFYGNDTNACPELPQDVVDERVTFLQTMITSGTSEGQQFLFFVSNEYVNMSKPKSEWMNTRTRSQFRFGRPIDVNLLPSKGGGDTRNEEDLYVMEYFHILMQDRLFEALDMKKSWYYSTAYYAKPYLGGQKDQSDEYDRINVKFNSATLERIASKDLFDIDLYVLIFAVVFVFVFMSVHLGSVFISSFTLLHMVMSVPFSLFIYTGIFQVQ